MTDIPEVSSLRWLANMFPYTENPKDDTDKISNAINLYCTAGADKIESLQRDYDELANLLMKRKNGGENK